MTRVHPTRLRQRPAAIAADPDSLVRRLGGVFFKARLRQGWSQRQTALRTGDRVSRSTVSDLERGRSLPAFDALIELADALHLAPQKLIDMARLGGPLPTPGGLPLIGLLTQAGRSEAEGSYVEATALYRVAAARLREGGERDFGARLQQGLSLRTAIVQARLGLSAQAREHALRATAAAGSEPAWAARAYLLAAILMHEARWFDAAEVHAARAVALVEERDNAALAAAHWQSARAQRALGRLERARSSLLTARPAARAARDTRLALAIDGELARCLAALERHDAGCELLRRVVALACRHGTTEDELYWRLERIGRSWPRDRVAALAEARVLVHLARCSRDDRLRYRAEFWMIRTGHAAEGERRGRLRRLLALRARARAIRTIDLPGCFAPSDPGCPALVPQAEG